MAEGAERPAVEAFEERCVEATVRLTHAMSPTVVLLVQALDCPVEIWKRLERQYEKRTAASKLSLVQKYFGAKMAEGESAEKHLLNMSELCDRLAAMELPVPKEFQPLMIQPWRTTEPKLSQTCSVLPVAVPDRVPANLRVMHEMVAVRNEPQPELAAVHSRPTRMKKPIDRYGVDEQAKVLEVDDEVEEMIASALCAADMDEPKSLREARKRPDASKWLAAAQEEMDSLMEHETWSLTKLPPGRKIVGSKWVFKVKLDENGEAARYKCRLVAQGYTQVQRVDYHETFAPVARFGSIRTLLATAAQRGMHVHQMDVHTAFLNGKLEEDIYMSQPEGFVVEGKEEQVCHLHRSLYGLKQSPRCWNRELNCHLLDSGFQQSKADPCVYFRWKNGNLNIVSIYVDDLILVVDLMKNLEQTKEELSARFKMKDLGQLRYSLGIVCEQRTGCIKLNQRPYIDNLVRRFGLDKACGVSTPADTCVKLVPKME